MGGGYHGGGHDISPDFMAPLLIVVAFGQCRRSGSLGVILQTQTLWAHTQTHKLLGLPSKGRRNAVGSIEPSRNSGSINGGVLAVTVGTGNNNDMKIPCRMPITLETHDTSCTESCYETCGLDDVVRAVEASLSAQGRPLGAFFEPS